MITLHLVATFIVHVVITVILIEMLRFFLVQDLDEIDVFPPRSIDRSAYLEDFVVRATFVRFVVFGVFEQDFVHICRGVLEKFIRGIEDDQCDFTITENTEFIGFLHQTELPFCEGHLPVPFIGDLRDLNLLSSHSPKRNERRKVSRVLIEGRRFTCNLFASGLIDGPTLCRSGAR